MKTAVFWDMDGTLFDSEALCVKIVAESLRHFGLPVPDISVLKACNGPTVDGMAKLVNVPEELIPAFGKWMVDYEVSVIPEVQKLYSGVAEALRSLKNNAMLFVASNGSPDYFNASLRHYGIYALFTDVPAERDSLSKGARILRDMKNNQIDKAVMVGDRDFDYLAAREAGIPFIAATYGYAPEGELQSADAFAKSAKEAAEKALLILRA
ncbi:MAG: HAD hydrolase-like protein [Eubacteriales bacterium]|nr:HAD hydrolase-like protein [Eubacteriales bacterium]MDD3883025.1 HAD hydrolase-like protein [Eubacteriales bacterium]MDD4513648.1 HAD hydrolase-like protein [Eubacteriales bacterium]